MRNLPPDFLERAYAGVLGKLIGVYLARPFENWTYERILKELGPIENYVHDKLDVPLVVTDDDVAGTFTFVRAFDEHRVSNQLTSREIGLTWLNALIEDRSILWWGGAGTSTEHTTWLNLKRGIAAPDSGSVRVNGQAVAEQIGAQIFIDGWAIVAAGDPALAAKLAGEAGRVSHDGVSVHAAQFWAAMEAAAFTTSDISELFKIGLAQIPADSGLRPLIADVREWCASDGDWHKTRARIADKYGYHKYPGHCHVIPNHALMLMAVLYAPDDFDLAQTIVCTSGWDTDCNAGNVGCLLGIKLGLAGLQKKVDWRGPVADRLLNSSAHGAETIDDAVRTTYRLAGYARQLAGEPPLPAPKNGARFHFSLPGAVQGFMPKGDLKIENAPFEVGRALKLTGEGAALTPTFSSPDTPKMRTYELMATPIVNPGQVVSARIVADAANKQSVAVRLRALVYTTEDALNEVDGESVTLEAGAEQTLRWRLPDIGGQPIQSLGVALSGGAVWLDWLRWDGAPNVTLLRPADGGDFWRRAWVNGADHFFTQFPLAFRVVQDRGEGLVIYGGGDGWTDLMAETRMNIHLATHAGIAVRVQGLRRFLAVLMDRTGVLRIVRQYDDERVTLAETPFPTAFETLISIRVTTKGDEIIAQVGDTRLEATSDKGLKHGGVGLVVAEGSCSCGEIHIGPGN